MSLSLFLLVLFAAALHAGWNAIVKLGGDKTVTTALVTGAAAAISLLLLPFLRQPAPQAGCISPPPAPSMSSISCWWRVPTRPATWDRPIP